MTEILASLSLPLLLVGASHCMILWLMAPRLKTLERVMPGASDSEESVQSVLDAAAAHFLEKTLKPRDVIGVASWSATLLSMVEQMHPIWKPHARGGKTLSKRTSTGRWWEALP